MAPKRGGSRVRSGDALWRAPVGERPIPRISSSMMSVRQAPNYNYAMSIVRHPDPIGMGLASEAFLEPAGPDCIVPGQQKRVKLLGLQVWPIDKPEINLKALEPIVREVKTFCRMMDRAFDLMQAPFNER
eukprot:c10912_g1_i1 orf=107-496(+)